MKHYMHLNDGPYKKIEAQTKTIEMRLYDAKRRTMHKGDILEIENRTTGQKMEVEIVEMYVFSSFAQIYERWDKVSLGYESDDIAKPEDMEEYYPKEEIESYGVVAIELKVLRTNI